MHRALELRLQGFSYLEIADELNISTKTAHEYVEESLNSVRFENAERAAELRDVIVMRNDMLISVLLEKALDGDLYAIDRIGKLQEQQAHLMGAKVADASPNKEDEHLERPMILLPEVLGLDAPQLPAPDPLAMIVDPTGVAEPVDVPILDNLGDYVSIN